MPRHRTSGLVLQTSILVHRSYQLPGTDAYVQALEYLPCILRHLWEKQPWNFESTILDRPQVASVPSYGALPGLVFVGCLCLSSVGLMSLVSREYLVPIRSISSLRSVRTSNVPSLDRPSTTDKAQLSGPRKRILSTIEPKSRARIFMDWWRSRAKK